MLVNFPDLLKDINKNFKEVKYEDTVKVFYSYENDKHIVTIKNNEETELHAIIVMY